MLCCLIRNVVVVVHKLFLSVGKLMKFFLNFFCRAFSGTKFLRRSNLLIDIQAMPLCWPALTTQVVWYNSLFVPRQNVPVIMSVLTEFTLFVIRFWCRIIADWLKRNYMEKLLSFVLRWTLFTIFVIKIWVQTQHKNELNGSEFSAWRRHRFCTVADQEFPRLRVPVPEGIFRFSPRIVWKQEKFCWGGVPCRSLYIPQCSVMIVVIPGEPCFRNCDASFKINAWIEMTTALM